MLGLIALWFRQVREAELESGEAADMVSLPDKSKLFEALQRLPISFGMAMRVSWLFCFFRSWSGGKKGVEGVLFSRNSVEVRRLQTLRSPRVINIRSSCWTMISQIGERL